VVINKFNPRNYLKQGRPKITFKPKINNYNQLPEAPSVVVKPTVQAPKVTVKPTFNNWVEARKQKPKQPDCKSLTHPNHNQKKHRETPVKQ
jgi:hypothetical protein